MIIGLPDRECRFEEADQAAKDAGLNGDVVVAGDASIIHRIMRDQDLLQCGVFAAVAFDASSIAEGVSQKRHRRTISEFIWLFFDIADISNGVNPVYNLYIFDVLI